MHMKEIHNPLLKEELKPVGTHASGTSTGVVVISGPTGGTKSEADFATNRHERRAAEAKARAAGGTFHNTKQAAAKRYT
jgi:hypothetical protein